MYKAGVEEAVVGIYFSVASCCEMNKGLPPRLRGRARVLCGTLFLLLLLLLLLLSKTSVMVRLEHTLSYQCGQPILFGFSFTLPPLHDTANGGGGIPRNEGKKLQPRAKSPKQCHHEFFFPRRLQFCSGSGRLLAWVDNCERPFFIITVTSQLKTRAESKW